ncbi:hypothetical protein QJQ45_008285 [Haematococcus lacustris]|nr:hypothetical protein QJQ45_008285 [Haematococcus lacustris]
MLSLAILPVAVPCHLAMAPYCLGGVTYWLSIFPVDCIKSAMQTDSIVRSERKYPDFITTAQKLWAEGGIKRFYKGFTPCIIRAAPANGVMLLTVEKVQALLKQG